MTKGAVKSWNALINCITRLKNIIDEITSSKVIKIVLSNKKNKDFKYNKIKFSLKENLKGEFYQIEKYTDKQVFHENITFNELELTLSFNSLKNIFFPA